MSKFIEVNHQKIDSAVSAIEEDIAEIKKLKGKFKSKIESLKSFWDGSDFQAFKTSYESSNGIDEMLKSVSKALQARADFLKFCSNEYKSAQADAVNRANDL